MQDKVHSDWRYPSITVSMTEWEDYLNRDDIFNEEALDLVEFFYNQHPKGIPASEVAQEWHVHTNKITAINRAVSRKIYADRNAEPPPNTGGGKRFWNLLFEGLDPSESPNKNLYYWRLRKELFEAFKNDAIKNHSKDVVETDAEYITKSQHSKIQHQRDIDKRKIKRGEFWQRVYQSVFRKCLLSIYNNQCAVTGCAIIETLQAAHILQRKGEDDNSVGNGLILRADVHLLFDNRKLSISPEDFKVIVHPDLRDSEYGAFHGKKISLPIDQHDWPSKEALRAHKKESGL